MTGFWFCTQGTPQHLNPRNAWEIIIQFRHVIAVTVTDLYHPSSFDVGYDIWSTIIQHSECHIFPGKMENVLSSTPRELVQFLQLINQFILLCASRIFCCLFSSRK